MPAARIFLQLIADLVVYLGLLIRPRKAIVAENLFLHRQLALNRRCFANREYKQKAADAALVGCIRPTTRT
ncbi:MAG TPA: hypothetical protein VE860_26100 [Chthoniobacterales bacterium]|jgi:hypothetical protein|nr:hypothetical protein [Chthoniobacterales bacterium]